MFLYYGDVFLVRCQVLQAEREAVTDTANNYLYTLHRYRVRGIYNPQVNSYLIPAVDAGGNFPTAPTQATGAFATVTDRALRHYMLQPRRRLILRTPADPFALQVVPGNPGPAPFNWVDSPGTNADGTRASLDCNNGPRPINCDVVYVSGTKSFVVDFTFETYLNEAALYTTTPSVMLSHVWKVEEDIDQDYYSTRIIDGYARFRGDRLTFLGAMADDFRGWLFHARPDGFKRVQVNVRCAEDGNSLVYRLVDKQLAMAIVPDGVTRIELVHTVSDNGWNYEKAIKSMVTAGAGAAVGAASGGSTSAIIGVAGQAAGKAGGEALAGIIPMKIVEAVARVWGRQDVTRKSLENVAIAAVVARLNASVNPGARALAGTHLQVRHDCAGTFVEAVGTVQTSMSGTFVTFLNNILGDAFGFPNVPESFPDDDATPGVLDLGPDGTGHNLHKNLGTQTFTRSTYVERLATAALMVPNGLPATGTANAPAQTRTPP